jgi:hypothetical protein
MSVNFCINNDNDDSGCALRRKIVNSITDKKRERYAILVKLFNNLFETENKSLLEFKYINIEKVDIDDSTETMHKKVKKIKKHFGIKLNDEFTHRSLVTVLRKLLESIDYKLLKSKNKEVYYIRN